MLSSTATAGNIRISGATISNHGTYAQTLTATVDGKTSIAGYEVIIKDPCSSATFETTPAGLVNMTVNMPSSATSTQTVVIKTDVQIANPTIVCPFTVSTTLAPPALYIRSVANTISVDASKIVLPADSGTHTFMLAVNSSNFPGSVLQKTYNFNVVVACSVSSLSITSYVWNITYILN